MCKPVSQCYHCFVFYQTLFKLPTEIEEVGKRLFIDQKYVDAQQVSSRGSSGSEPKIYWLDPQHRQEFVPDKCSQSKMPDPVQSSEHSKNMNLPHANKEIINDRG